MSYSSFTYIVAEGTTDFEVQDGVDGTIAYTNASARDAIQWAIDNVPQPPGGTVRIRAGQYDLDGAVRLPTGVVLSGEDRDATILRLEEDANSNVIESYYSTPNKAFHSGVISLTIDGNKAENASGLAGIFGGFAQSTFFDISVHHTKGNGIDLSFGFGQPIDNLNNLRKFWITECDGFGLLWVGQADSQLHDGWISVCAPVGGRANAALWVEASGSHITDLIIEGPSEHCIRMAWSGNVRFSNITIGGFKTHAVRIYAVDHITFRDVFLSSGQQDDDGVYDGFHIDPYDNEARDILLDGLQFNVLGGDFDSRLRHAVYGAVNATRVRVVNSSVDAETCADAAFNLTGAQFLGALSN